MIKNKEEKAADRERRKFQETVVQDFEKKSEGESRTQQLKLLSTINFYQTLTKRPNKETPLFPIDSSRSNHSKLSLNDKSNNENLENSLESYQKEKKILEGVIFNNIQNQMKIMSVNNKQNDAKAGDNRQNSSFRKEHSEFLPKSRDGSTEKKSSVLSLSFNKKTSENLKKPLKQKELIDSECFDVEDTRFSYQYTPNGGRKLLKSKRIENTINGKTPSTSEWKSSLQVNVNEEPKDFKEDMEKLASSFRKCGQTDNEEKVLNQAKLEALLNNFEKNERTKVLLNKINIEGKKVTNLGNFLAKARIAPSACNIQRSKSPLAPSSGRTPKKATKLEQKDPFQVNRISNKSSEKSRTPPKYQRSPLDKQKVSSKMQITDEILKKTPTKSNSKLRETKGMVSARSSKSPLGDRSSGRSASRTDYVDKSEEKKTPRNLANQSNTLKGKRSELRSSRSQKINDIMPSVNSSFRYRPNYFEPMEKEELERAIDEELNIRNLPRASLAKSRISHVNKKLNKSTESGRAPRQDRKSSLDKTSHIYDASKKGDKYSKLDSLIADLKNLSVLDSLREIEKEADF